MQRAVLLLWVVVLITSGCLTKAQKLESRLKNKCGDDDGDACWSLAQIYAKGDDGVEQDTTKATRYMRRACKLSDEGACPICRATSSCSARTEDDPPRPPPPPPSLKDRLTQALEACNGNSKEGCVAALAILKDACNDGNKEECVKLMLPIMRKLCDLGEREACTGYAEIAMQVCKAGDGCACAELGRLMYLGRPPIPPNMSMGKRLIKLGCTTCSKSEACQLPELVGGKR